MAIDALKPRGARRAGRRLRFGAAALATLALAGCGSLFSGGLFSTGEAELDGRTVEYFAPHRLGGAAGGPIDRVFAGPCVFRRDAPTPQLEAFGLTTIAPVLVKRALDLLTNAIKRAGEERAVAVYAARAYPFDPFRGPGFNCVQFVRGEFHGRAKDMDAGAEALPGAERSARRVAAGLADAGIYLKPGADFFMEARVRFSADGSHFQLAPTYLLYGRPFDGGPDLSRRALFVEIGLNEAGKSLAEADASRGLLKLEVLSAGDAVRFFGPNDPRAPRMLWAPIGAAPGGQGGGLNLEMRVIELREANKVLAQLGAILEEEQVSERVRRGLFPTDDEVRADLEDRATAIDNFITASRLYDAHLSDYRARSLAVGPNPTPSERAVLKALLARAEAQREVANSWADQAGLRDKLPPAN